MAAGLTGPLPLGPKPAPPRNVTAKRLNDGVWLISWLPPDETQVAVHYYDIEYKIGDQAWKKLNDQQIPKDTTSYHGG